MLAGARCDCRDLSGVVHRAVLGRLRHRHDRRLARVLETHVLDRAADECGSKLPVRRCDREQLPAGEALRRPALVRIDVRGLRADHGVVRAHDRLQCSAVRAGPIEHEEDLSVGSELTPDELARTLRPFVGAVCMRMPRVGLCHGIENRWVRPRSVVTREPTDGGRHAGRSSRRLAMRMIT